MIFNNFGPALNAYDSRLGWTVSEAGSLVGTLFENANEFTPSVGGQITRIDIALSNDFGTNNATVELVQDNGGLADWTGAGRVVGGRSGSVREPVAR